MGIIDDIKQAVKDSSNIPDFLSHLKVVRGYPVPFFVTWIEGKPDFRLFDVKKWELCNEKKLCCICGKKLHKYHYFVTGPKGLANQVHSDTPMHLDCAEYSLNTCPYLFYEKRDRNDAGEVYENMTENNVHGIMAKPDTIHLIKSDKFSPFIRDRQRLIKFRTVSFETFEYLNGKLTKL